MTLVERYRQAFSSPLYTFILGFWAGMLIGELLR